MNTHESYVSLETAKLLKQAGFDWEVNHYYLTQNGKTEAKSDFRHPAQNYNESMATMDSKSFEFEVCSCPTLEVAQRWLREVKRVFIHVSVYAVTEQGPEITDSDKFSVYADTWDSQSEFWNKWTSLFEIDDFNTYEEAQEAGIKKVLELILEKRE